jgi:hypothetical protein
MGLPRSSWASGRHTSDMPACQPTGTLTPGGRLGRLPRRREPRSTSTIASDGSLVPWLAAEGPLARPGAYASSAAKASDLDRGGGCSTGARGAVLLLLRAAAACEIELREKDAGVCCSGERGGASGIPVLRPLY